MSKSRTLSDGPYRPICGVFRIKMHFDLHFLPCAPVGDMSDYFDRKPLPHEDDVHFERVLRKIAHQEAMPRPLIHGPTEVEQTRLDEFLGDTWHWDSYSPGTWFILLVQYSIAGVIACA